MLRSLALVAAALLAMAQAPARPFPNDQEPPAGWYCERQNLDETVDPAHVCRCVRLCEKHPDGTVRIVEDEHCSVYCHMDHCHCGNPCAKDTQ